MLYEKPPTITKEEAEAKFKTADRDELCILLLGIYEIEDWKWVQNTYLHYAINEDKWIASAAITGIGHLARIIGKIEKDKIFDILKNISNSRPELEGKVNDTINDINLFSKN